MSLIGTYCMYLGVTRLHGFAAIMNPVCGEVLSTDGFGGEVVDNRDGNAPNLGVSQCLHSNVALICSLCYSQLTLELVNSI